MLSKSHRFHGLGSLNFAYRQGVLVRGQYCSLRFVPNSRRQTYRLAVVVSRKVSKSAVVRNRIRRRLYAVAADCLPADMPPHDLLLTVYGAQLRDLPSAELSSQVRSLFAKAGISTRPLQHGIVESKGPET